MMKINEMKKRYIIIMGAILLSTIVLISSIYVGLLINHNKENRNVDDDYTDFIREENELKTTALPTASPELLSQIEEAPKEIVKPRVDTVDPKYYTLDYEIKNSIGCGVDELEFTDIPVGKTFVYEGVEFTITDYTIMTGEDFFNEYADEEDIKLHQNNPEYYGEISKNGTYAVIHWNYKKIDSVATSTPDFMTLTDMVYFGTPDPFASSIVVDKTGGKELTWGFIPVGEQRNGIFVLSSEMVGTDLSRDHYILLPKVSGEVEKKPLAEGKMTGEEAWAIYQKNKNKFYRIKLTKGDK